MALIGRRSTPLGIDATYWKIIRDWNLWIGLQERSCMIAGYVDQNARNENPDNPLTKIEFHWFEDDCNDIHSDTVIQDMYDKIKEDPAWNDMVDG